MKERDEKTTAKPERATTVEEATGDQHIATRSVVMHRPRAKKIKLMAPLGRHVRTKVWNKPADRKRPPSIGSMQPPGGKK